MTEQGIASYALAVWWLGLDFEEASEALKALLECNYPEVRKVDLPRSCGQSEKLLQTQ